MILHGEGFGLDRLSLSFPLRSFDADRFSTVTTRAVGVTGEQSSTWGETVVLERKPARGSRAGEPLASVFVGATVVEGRPWGKVEANPARLRDPAGCSLAPLEALPELAARMFEVASTLVDPACPVEEAAVKRLDVARDYRGVRLPALYVRGLAHLRRPYARRVGVWNSPQCGAAQTLHVGSGAGMVRLYDQHEAYAERGAPEGSLRFEVEARGGWLARAGVRRLSDVSVEAVGALAVDRWRWSGMGTRVSAAVGVVDAVEAMVCKCPGRCADGEHLSRARADRLLGMLVREAFGSGRTAARTETRYASLKAALGQVPSADLMAAGTVELEGRLDFATGREAA